MMRTGARRLAPLMVVAALVLFAAPPPAQALDPTKPICTLAGLVNGLAGKVCSVARRAGTVLKAGQKLLGGHLGGAAETLGIGGATAAKTITAATALSALALWVDGGARFVLHKTATVISTTTRPELQSTWFSASYWRMAGISALLTLPFLFAAAIQALLRSDLGLLLRSALGYLPLGLLAVSVAAPLTQLLLAASDELSGLVSSASGFTAAGFVHVPGVAIAAGTLTAFPVFFASLLAVAATMTLWIELLIRSAAVYVIVLMLPLFFAALVWPARRVWAVRAVEVLVALILSKFAIVAVLALGGAALGHTLVPSLTQMLAGTTLVMLAAFSPWALLRLLPLHELAAGVEGMRGAGPRGLTPASAGAEGAYERLQSFRDELAEAHRHRSPAGGQEAARSAVGKLEAGSAGDDHDPPSVDVGVENRAPETAQPAPFDAGQSARPDAGQSAPPDAGQSAPDAGQSSPLDAAQSAPTRQTANLTSPFEIGPDPLPEDQLAPPPASADRIRPPTNAIRELPLDPWLPSPPATEAPLNPRPEPGQDDDRR